MTPVTGPYLRTTVLGGGQRVDVVLPTDQPVAEVLPAVLDLLEIADPGTVSMLHTDAGQAIELDRSLSHTGLRDGVVLHLVAVREAPAEPVVADLIDVFETADTSRDRFDAAAQQWLLSASGAVLLALGGAGLASTAGPWAPFLLAGSAVALWLMALAASAPPWSPAWISLAVAASLLGIGALVTVQISAPQRGLLTLTAVMASVLAAGACADRWRPATIACAVFAGMGSAMGLTWMTTSDVTATGAVGMATSVAVCGLLPQWALGLSGAFTIDGRVQRGDVLGRSLAQHCLLEAGRTLTAALAVTCLLFAVSGSAVAAATPTDRWACAVYVVLLLVWICRIRHFPLTVQRVLVLGAAVVSITSWMVGAAREPIAVLPVLSITLMLVGALALVGHRARASALLAAIGRRWIRRVEVIGVLATVPIVVGFFGVYGDLIATF
ncbi:MAG: EsaB/YukD family protein [Ornithinimicrobium sp.]